MSKLSPANHALIERTLSLKTDPNARRMYSANTINQLLDAAREEQEALALGGQHSGGEKYWPDIEDLAERLVKETYRPGKIDGTGYLYTDVIGAVATGIAEERARHTTPARAEAQDEGAAVEPVAWGLQFPGKRLRHTFDAERIAQGWADHAGDGAKVVPLYAHPSPTPAADADNLEKAVALLERWDWSRSEKSGKGTVETDTRDFIAALKSTAAKE